MGFEIFNRKIVWTGSPTITFTKLGRISFNKAATALIKKNAIENVLLMWDVEKKVIGIRPTAKKEARSYKVYENPKDNGCGFAASTFFKWIGYDLAESRQLPTQWDEQSQTFLIEILPAYLKQDTSNVTHEETEDQTSPSAVNAVKRTRRVQRELL
jgi:hypothetical protein